MNVGIKHVLNNQPFSTEEEYPYKAVRGTCNPEKASVNLAVSEIVSGAGTDFLADAVAKYSPSVAVDASNWSTYRGGVLTECGTSLNHGVQVWGVKDGHWFVRNSWGKRWGDKGSITLAAGNTCGISTEVHYAK